MKSLTAILLVFSCATSLAQESEEYWELYETYASADAAKYHDILQCIEAGDLKAAKEKLLSYQAAEILVLQELQKQRGITDRSKQVIEMVRKYNPLYAD